MKSNLLITLTFCLMPLILTASSFHSQEESKQNSSSVVKVFTHSISPSYLKPWNAGDNSSSTGTGVIVSGNMILTAAHVVTNATYIEVKKHGDPKKFFADVKWIAHDADLALLEIDDESFYEGTTPKELGNTPERQDDVAVYGYPEGGNKISITQGIISRIENTTYVHSHVELLTIQIDAAINPGNSGGPAFNKEGEVVGIAIQNLPGSNNIGYIAPVPVIQHFFDDIKDGKYDGFPKDGLAIQTMENQDLKDYYGMKDRTGVLVSQIVKNSSVDGYLKKEDVLLEVDGSIVADDNTAEVQELGRFSADFLFKRHFIGDEIHVKVLRNKKEINITIPLKASSNIITYNHEEKPRYYIYGGFVFMPLTATFFANITNLPDSFTYEYIFSNLVDSKFKQKELVFISTLLEDKVNAGYNISHTIVRKINEEQVSSLNDLVEKIKRSKQVVKITTLDGDIIILNKKKVVKAEAGILDRYGIKEPACLLQTQL